jgi:DNA-directed RNA polymerase subunit RPC12/RpoP
VSCIASNFSAEVSDMLEWDWNVFSFERRELSRYRRLKVPAAYICATCGARLPHPERQNRDKRNSPTKYPQTPSPAKGILKGHSRQLRDYLLAYC